MSNIIYGDKPAVFSDRVVYRPVEINNVAGEEIGLFVYNQNTDRIEVKHANPDVDGKYMRPLTQNIASNSTYGVFKVGSNLLINESTGYLSSFSLLLTVEFNKWLLLYHQTNMQQIIHQLHMLLVT